MQTAISIRPLTEQDGPAFAGLSYSSEDGGSIRYAANYRIDAVQAVRALHGDVEGVAACAHDHTRLIGVGLARFGRCQYEGELHPYALIGNLIVHPDYRGQGIALQMTQQLVDIARERFGNEGVLLANYQSGNLASRRIFTRWMKTITGPMTYLPLQTLAIPPASAPEVIIGPVDPDEFDCFSENLNEFYQDYNLFQPVSGLELAETCRSSPFASPVRHAYCVVGRDGRMLAGLVALEEYRLKQIEVRGIPLVLGALNQVAKLIPKGGEIQELYLDRAWFLPGHDWALRQLIDTVRWIWHDRASHVSLFFDPRGALREALPTRPWTVTTRSEVALLGPAPLNKDRPICPIY